jgi:hypothetical protein
MLPQPIQIGLDASVAGRTRGAVDDLGFFKEANEFPNHADKGCAQSVGCSLARAPAFMPCKPIDDSVVDLRDADIRLIEPITKMPGAMPQMMNRARLISTGDEMVDIRLNQWLQRARVESPPLLRHCER